MTITPTLPLLQLSEEETATVTRLTNKLSSDCLDLDILDSYYNGSQRIRDLGISVPPQLRGLHTVVGWPQIAVDAVEERLNVDGFRYPSTVDADERLWSIWQANNLDEESQLAHLDALIYGRSYIAVGTAEDSEIPLITVETARQMTLEYDVSRRAVKAALRVYGAALDGRATLATLYLPDQTISLASGGSSGWQVVDRDVHNFGAVPVTRLANRQRITERSGASEINQAVRSITDSACRTLLGMEVTRELFAAPARYLLGASESAFQEADGTPKSKWQTYAGVFNAIEADEEGNVPTIWQAPSLDPSVYTRIIDSYAQEFAAITGLPAALLGRSSDNPPSADAIRSAENRLVMRVKRRQQTFSGGWEDALRLALKFMGSSTAEDAQIETMWTSPATPTPGATSDAVTKQIASGALPATSDVTLGALGYSSVQRARIAIDRKREAGQTAAQQIAASLNTPGSVDGSPASV